MNKQNKRDWGRDVGTARNEFERERERRERRREGGRVEKVFGGAVLFFWLCCFTDNTKGGEARQLSTSFRF